ncbi:MAG: RyR domain-containing protein [Devosia sp.]
MTRRFLYFAAELLLAGLAGFALALFGLGACAPAPLPGDEGWTLGLRLAEAFDLVLRGGNPACFLGTGTGIIALWLAGHAMWLLIGLAAAMLAWETLGRTARLALWRARGGHSLLAGVDADLAGLARRQRHVGAVLYLSPDENAATRLARRHPFAEIGALADRVRNTDLLTHFGSTRARLLAAVTASDSINRDIAEIELSHPGHSEVLVRLERSSVRVLSSHRLRQLAEQNGRRLTVLSLDQLRTRRGMAAAMPGRYTIEGSPRVHIALCGSGQGLEAAALEVARQGYGLETEKPLLSILRTGSGDFGVAELERLLAAESSEVRLVAAAASVPGAIDRAISDVVLSGPPLLAVHCVADIEGDAEELARRWEDELVANHLPVPPIVAYTREERRLGLTGMIRCATTPDLAEAREVAALMDGRARAMHEHFLAAQRSALGTEFGKAPAQVEWELLDEIYRDDNRNVADQMDYKLARVFMASRPGTESAVPRPEHIEVLAKVAHARWIASKAVSGWRYGKTRDNQKLLHPDMIPYAELDEPGKQKDRDEVATLPKFAAISGEALLVERRVALTETLTESATEGLARALKSGPATQLPVIVLPLDGEPMASTAASLINAGIAVELVIDATMDDARHDLGSKMPNYSALLAGAWRIHASLERPARQSVKERTHEMVDKEGRIHARH